MVIICSLCVLFILFAGCVSHTHSSSTTTTTTPKCTEVNQTNGSVLVTCYGQNVTVVNNYVNNGAPFVYSYPFLMPYYQPYFGYGYPLYAYSIYNDAPVYIPVVAGRSSYYSEEDPIAVEDHLSYSNARSSSNLADPNENAIAPAEGSDNPDPGDYVEPASEQEQMVQEDNIAEPSDPSNGDNSGFGEVDSGDNGGFGEASGGDNAGFGGDSSEDFGGDGGGD